MEQLAALHPRHNTFPDEVLLGLAAEAIAESGASPDEPIQYEGMRDRYLTEYRFRGKSQQHKCHYALMAAAMIKGEVYPDLLDEADGWGIEDMWDTPSTPSCSTAGWRPSGRDEHPRTLPLRLQNGAVSSSTPPRPPNRRRRTPPPRKRHGDRSSRGAGHRWWSSSDRRDGPRSGRRAAVPLHRGRP